MKTNTEGKIRQSGESLVLGEKYDHPAWKNNECHAKVKLRGVARQEPVSLKIAKKADLSLDLFPNPSCERRKLCLFSSKVDLLKNTLWLILQKDML